MKTQSFPKKRKVLSPLQFKMILDEGKRIRSALFTVFVRSPSPVREGRLGVSISKRVGKANERNRIRRVVREAFRKREDLKERDWVFLAQPTAAEKENDELFKDVSSILNRFINKV